MVIYTTSTGNIINIKWGNPWGPIEHRTPTTYHVQDVGKKNDTFILIFNHSQKELLKALEKSDLYKIIYKSKPAVNKVPGHGMEPRNTVVVVVKQ